MIQARCFACISSMPECNARHASSTIFTSNNEKCTAAKQHLQLATAAIGDTQVCKNLKVVTGNAARFGRHMQKRRLCTSNCICPIQPECQLSVAMAVDQSIRQDNASWCQLCIWVQQHQRINGPCTCTPNCLASGCCMACNLPAACSSGRFLAGTCRQEKGSC